MATLSDPTGWLLATVYAAAFGMMNSDDIDDLQEELDTVKKEVDNLKKEINSLKDAYEMHLTYEHPRTDHYVDS